MVRGNNRVPDNHFHKHWNPNASQKGHITTFFDQPAQKKSRRVRRAQKAASVFPRPVTGPIRPVIRCMTQRYNFRVRLGRGFTHEELRANKISRAYARTIGIAVDHRRKNWSKESLDVNSQRLASYLQKVKVFPLKAKQAELASVVQLTKPPLPPAYEAVPLRFDAPRLPTPQEKKQKAYEFMRKNKRFEKIVGYKVKRDKRKEERAKAAKDKAKK